MNFAEILGIFLAALSGILAYLAPAIKLWIQQKAKEDDQFRLDVVTFVTAARQVYTDHDEMIAYILRLVEQKYPGLDSEHVLANIKAVLEWLEQGDISIYTNRSK